MNRRKKILIFTFVILLTGAIAIIGYTYKANNRILKDASLPKSHSISLPKETVALKKVDLKSYKLNPKSLLPILVWTKEKPKLPEFSVWEYTAGSTPPVNIEKLLHRIWNGKKYEILKLGEKGEYYRLPPYQSKYGRFRETLTVEDSFLSWEWEINENYPKPKEMKKAPVKAIEDAREYALNFLGNDLFFEYPVPFSFAFEEGRSIKNIYEFKWEHRINNIPVYGEGLNVSVIPEGIPKLSLRWSSFEPVNSKPNYMPLNFDEALFSVNYVRSFDGISKCTEYNTDDAIVSARVVYSNVFSDKPSTYRPAWEFIITCSPKSYEYPILVDCMTGRVWSNHDGIKDPYGIEK
ncbi:MAG TPA: hypothetical protein VIO64_11420 [Pseudobacteroides sp.]|uniref:hypothetical protein n=1 Tax=Pseudobacteroides sp. TaxID=1968840 RepID=UPI002F95488C